MLARDHQILILVRIVEARVDLVHQLVPVRHRPLVDLVPRIEEPRRLLVLRAEHLQADALRVGHRGRSVRLVRLAAILAAVADELLTQPAARLVVQVALEALAEVRHLDPHAPHASRLQLIEQRLELRQPVHRQRVHAHRHHMPGLDQLLHQLQTAADARRMRLHLSAHIVIQHRDADVPDRPRRLAHHTIQDRSVRLVRSPRLPCQRDAQLHAHLPDRFELHRIGAGERVHMVAHQHRHPRLQQSRLTAPPLVMLSQQAHDPANVRATVGLEPVREAVGAGMPAPVHAQLQASRADQELSCIGADAVAAHASVSFSRSSTSFQNAALSVL